ncbi:amidase [Mycobacteroides abscessus subsp. abscessus]|nr:amidase [Mycobacteroides abscessus subsp. abscessus]SII12647.1 amidase [Mycobacteroides abscessus subsp. abscessus]
MTSTVNQNAVSTTDSEALHYQDATALAALIASRQVSSREVVQAHLDRIAEVNPKINAIVTLLADEALRGADAADAALAGGRDVGPLHGVPVTVKDALDTAGIPTQRGSKIFAGFIPDDDATAVKRIKAAGGILLAKTNAPEFSAWTETDNAVTGRTNNPWNLERTPGGSSGGESAAVASGMSPMGIGSDLAISLRGPAAFTGVAALKATHGRIPFTGHFAPMASAWWHVGPMARTVRDVALGYSILSGPDGFDGYAVHAKEIDSGSTDSPDRPSGSVGSPTKRSGRWTRRSPALSKTRRHNWLPWGATWSRSRRRSSTTPTPRRRCLRSSTVSWPHTSRTWPSGGRVS